MLFKSLNSLQARRAKSRRGFTIIELVVVILIIAILLAIGIPAYLNVRSTASDRAAQSTLRVALTDARGRSVDTDDFSTATAANLAADESSLTFQAAASTGSNVVSILVIDGPVRDQTVFIAAVLSNDNCWLVRDSLDGSGTQYARTSTAACVAGDTQTWVQSFRDA